MSTFLALDQALSCTGLALYLPSKVILASQIKTHSQDPIGFRLLSLESHLIDIFTTFQPSHCFYEYVYSSKTTPFESLKVLGLLEKLLNQYHIPHTCFRSSPKEKNSWRSLIGLDSSNKSHLQEKLHLKGKANHNISDAIGILGAGLLSFDIIEKHTAFYNLPITVSYERDSLSLYKLSQNLREMPPTVSSEIS